MPVWKTLRTNTPKVSPGSIDHIRYDEKVQGLDLNYMKGMKTLTFTGVIKSHEHPVGYNIIVTFKKVEPTANLTPEEIEQGFQPKPSLSSNELLVRCSCPSYRFRFDKANRDHRAGTGARFPIYIRKTNRKPNNPLNLPGLCVHESEFLQYLLERGFIVD